MNRKDIGHTSILDESKLGDAVLDVEDDGGEEGLAVGDKRER